MSNHRSSHSLLTTIAGLFAVVFASSSGAAVTGVETGVAPLAPATAAFEAACNSAHTHTASTPCGNAATTAKSTSSPTYTYQTFDYPGAAQTIIWGINDFNEFTGQYTFGSGTAHAMVYRHGRFEALDPGVLGNYFSAAGGPNDLGTTYGAYADDASGLQHGFVIQGTHFATVDFPGHLNSNVDQINVYGTIAGVYWDADGAFHGVLRQGHDYDTPVNVAGARETYPLGINDNGEIVGYSDTNPNLTHGFYRSANGQFTTIDVPNALATVTFEINDAGQITGYYVDASGNVHGFVETRGQFRNLDVPGAASTVATAINNLGVVAGEYFDSAGLRHGFVATP